MPEGEPRTTTPAPWRRRTATGVVATAIALGLREALEERRSGQAVVVDVSGDPYDPLAPLELHLDDRGPSETWAVARPWLLG